MGQWPHVLAFFQILLYNIYITFFILPTRQIGNAYPLFFLNKFSKYTNRPALKDTDISTEPKQKHT